MRYAPTNFGEIIVEFNANDNPVPGLDSAHHRDNDLGPSSHPLNPGSII